MENILIIIAIIVIGLLFFYNLYKAIKYTFGKNSKSSKQNLDNKLGYNMFNSFIQIREGMTLYLLYKFNNSLSKDELDITFQNLIAAVPISAKNRSRHAELIEVLKKNDRITNFFLEAIRIKTTMMSKIGYMDEGSRIRMNLLDEGLSIADKSTSTNPMNPDEFIKKAETFLEECRNKYRGSIKLYNEYYQP